MTVTFVGERFFKGCLEKPKLTGSICTSHKSSDSSITNVFLTPIYGTTSDKLYLRTKTSWFGKVARSVVKQSRSTNLVLKQNCTPNSNYSGSYNNLKKLEKTTSKSPIFRFHMYIASFVESGVSDHSLISVHASRHVSGYWLG